MSKTSATLVFVPCPRWRGHFLRAEAFDFWTRLGRQYSIAGMEELDGAEWRAQGRRDRSQAGRPLSGNRLWRNRLHPGQYLGKWPHSRGQSLRPRRRRWTAACIPRVSDGSKEYRVLSQRFRQFQLVPNSQALRDSALSAHHSCIAALLQRQVPI
jgi:hypothetical protein